MDVKRTRLDQFVDDSAQVTVPAGGAVSAALAAIRAASAAQASRLQSAREYLLSRESAGTIEFIALRPWLRDEADISTRAFGSALRQAVAINHLGVIDFLLSTRRVSRQAHGNALEDAARYRHLDALRALLLFPGFPRENVDHILVEAANLGRIETIRVMQRAAVQFKQGSLANAFLIAIRQGHLDIAALIFRDLQENVPDILGSALAEAAADGHLDRVQFILRDCRHTQSEATTRAILHAASRGHLGVIQELLFFDLRLSASVVRRALVTAEENYHQAVAVLCRDFISVHEGKDRVEALIAASRQGWSGIVASELAKGPIPAGLQDNCIQLTSDARILALLRGARLMLAEHVREPSGITLQLKFHDIASRPERFLEYISRKGLPKRLILSDIPELSDDHGIMKRCITQLADGILTRGIFKRNPFGLLASDCSQDDTRLETLARFYSEIDVRNRECSQEILIGTYLHPRFFEFVGIAMSSLTADEKIARLCVLMGAVQPDLAIVGLVLVNPSIGNKALIRELLPWSQGQEVEVAKQVVNTHLRAAYAFSQGLSPALRAKIQIDPTGALRALQGELLCRELVLRAFEVQADDHDTAYKFEWLKVRIAQADENYLKRFLLRVTGKKTLSLAEPIIVSRSPHPDRFEYRCGLNNIALPHLSMTKEAFLEGLTASLRSEFDQS